MLAARLSPAAPIAIGYNNGWVALWNTATGQFRAQYPAHDEHRCCQLSEAKVQSVSFDGTYLTSVTLDGIYRTWDTNTQQLIVDTRIEATTSRTAFSEYGGRLIVLTDNPPDDPTLVSQLIRVPAPSLEYLNIVAQRCVNADGTRGVMRAESAAQLAEFVAQVEMLTDEQIPAGCRADVLAIADALLEQ